MNIKKVRKPAYEALCMKCRRPGPLAFSPKQAELAAREEEWRVLSKPGGLGLIKITLCPDRYAEREALEREK